MPLFHTIAIVCVTQAMAIDVLVYLDCLRYMFIYGDAIPFIDPLSIIQLILTQPICPALACINTKKGILALKQSIKQTDVLKLCNHCCISIPTN